MLQAPRRAEVAVRLAQHAATFQSEAGLEAGGSPALVDCGWCCYRVQRLPHCEVTKYCPGPRTA